MCSRRLQSAYSTSNHPDLVSRGVYEFEQPRKWLVKVAPYIRFVAGTLSLALPVAGSIVKWKLDDDAYKRIAENLDLSQKAFSALLGASGAVGKHLVHDDEADLSDALAPSQQVAVRAEDAHQYGQPLAAQGGLLRELQSLLKDRDPGFGGLKRVQNKRNAFFWIHPRYETAYYPEPPLMPPPEPEQ